MTSFDIVEDAALVLINDYKLGKLFDLSQEGFQTYCDGFLSVAVPRFWQCNQSLSYDLTNRRFDSDLTPMEISILSKLWVIAWWEKETNDAAQIALKLKVSSSFTFNSEAQNLKEKQNVIDKLNEEVDRQITAYLLMGLDSYVY